jgi:uncharacterized repeat protein (TIGR03803 family)
MSKLNWMTKACGVFLLWAGAAIALPAQTFTSLQSFDGTDGIMPIAGLVQGTDGNFYGAITEGGASDACGYGCGTVFKITTSGTLTTLHNFDGMDGYYSYGNLVEGTDGDFYGTTAFGGTNYTCYLSEPCGTIFKITPGGSLTTLHDFDETDGSRPYAGLLLASDGDFYGITYYGGSPGVLGAGTIFKITPSGTLTTLFKFSFVTNDGAYPSGGLIQGTDGNFYGTTSAGGTSKACKGGCGTVFEITPNGKLTTLHSFDGTDGVTPQGALVEATNGNFYGTTSSSEGTYGAGTIFEITPDGIFTTLHIFCSVPYCTDGAEPEEGLIQGTDGNLYGTAAGGGANSDGTVYSITPSGTLTTLHSFDGTDGEWPWGALVQGTNGEFYGTTWRGGTSTVCDGGCGTVFSLNVGLGQFVETLPTSGPVGGTVRILGSFLTGATSVTFNGTAATFTVNSKSEITTTVPTGATTGTVQVISPRLGTLSSNLPFTVKP